MLEEKANSLKGGFAFPFPAALANRRVHVNLFPMANYFLTGISGFLGNNLVREIFANDEDAHVVGLVFKGDPCRYLDKDKVTLVEGDILNPDSIETFLSTPVPEGKTYLVHAAGMISVRRKNPRCSFVNIDGTRNVLSAALNHKIDRFLYLSSVDALQRVPGDKPIVEQSSFPLEGLEGVYSRSKAVAGNLVLASKEKGLDVIIAHPSAMLGPYDPGHNPIDDAIGRFLKGKLPALVKGAYDLVDVRDVAKGICLLLEKGVNGECYLLTGNHRSVVGLIEEAGKAANKKPVRRTVPTFLVKAASPFISLFAKMRHKEPLFTSFAVDCLTQNSNYSHLKASVLGYEPRPLEKTMEDTVKWMKESGYLDK